MTTRSVVWFRGDLRVNDNAALSAAAAENASGGIVGLYVISPGDWLRHGVGGNRVAFTLACLADLSQNLRKLNIPLLIRTAKVPGDVPGIVAKVAKEALAHSVHAGIEYEVHEAARDVAAVSALGKIGCKLHLHHDLIILTPGTVLTGSDKPYTVFTPFKRRWFAVLAEGGGVRVLPSVRKQPVSGLVADPVPDTLAGFAATRTQELFPPTEAAAVKRLTEFVNVRLFSYKDKRDMPSIHGTSMMSAYLAAGVISPRVCLKAAQDANGGKLDAGDAGAVTWISELVWREFYKHVLAAFPRVCMNRAFKAGGDRVKWLTNEAHLAAWKTGNTGYPIVDAAQRQLLATGWMHNRLRMITAMFFTKDLLLDWRLGESYFTEHLLDGDLAANNGGWQWSAGVGTDAAPYFRIFNPTTQSEKFDEAGSFIRTWVPELASLDAKSIHDPLPMARMKLGYASQVVDHTVARERTLKAYKLAGSL